MLNLKYLESFIFTAECGSFHKAADAMYITPSALIKQINMLEDEVAAALFERTPRGLRLTPAGMSLYQDGTVLLADAQKALERARRTTEDTSQIIRVGTSPVSPADTIASLWDRVYEKWPELKIQIVPFANNEKAVERVFRNFGDEIDIICGVVDPVHLRNRRCGGTVVAHYPLNAAVSFHHPLAAKKKITPDDLRNHEIMIMRKGRMEVMDRVREDLSENRNDMRIHDFEMYDMDAFNYAEKTGAILLIMEKWLGAHPTMRMVEVEWNYSIPYGLLYASVPSEKVRRFLSCIKD